MEAYPPAYVQHNLPFIVLSGLGSQAELQPPPSVHDVLPGRASVRTSSEIPAVTGERADQLLQDFLSADGTNGPWNSRAASRRDLGHGFRIRAVGRVGRRVVQNSWLHHVLIEAYRTTHCRRRRLMRRSLQKLLRPGALPSQRRTHGSSIRQSLPCLQQPRSFQMVSLRLPGSPNTKTTYLLSSYPSSTSRPTLSRIAYTIIS